MRNINLIYKLLKVTILLIIISIFNSASLRAAISFVNNVSTTTIKKKVEICNLVVLLLAFVVLLLGSVFPGTSLAATYYVGTNEDQSDGGDCTNAVNTDCSLRDAVAVANAASGATSGSPHIINIPDGTYTITITGDDFNNASGDFDVKNYTKFQGTSQANTIIEGAATNSRVFEDADSDAEMTFDTLTIQNGNSTGLGSPEGGCIRVDGNPTILNNVTMDSCTATYGGAIVVTSTAGGDVNINDSTIQNNASTTSNGGAFASNGNKLTVNNSTFHNNVSGLQYGGAIAGRTVFIENSSVFTKNSAPANGGAIYATVDLTVSDSTFGGYGAGDGNSSNWGGALFLTEPDELLVERSTFIYNTANESGGSYSWLWWHHSFVRI